MYDSLFHERDYYAFVNSRSIRFTHFLSELQKQMEIKTFREQGNNEQKGVTQSKSLSLHFFSRGAQQWTDYLQRPFNELLLLPWLHLGPEAAAKTMSAIRRPNLIIVPRYLSVLLLLHLLNLHPFRLKDDRSKEDDGRRKEKPRRGSKHRVRS